MHPPSLDWKIEEQYNHLMDRVDRVTEQHGTEKTSVKKWPKNEHLKNIRSSTAFRFSKEIVFHDKQSCDAERYIGLALGQVGCKLFSNPGGQI